MAKKKNTPPKHGPGKHFFNVSNLNHATPAKRKQILGQVLDVMEKEEKPPAEAPAKHKENPPA